MLCDTQRNQCFSQTKVNSPKWKKQEVPGDRVRKCEQTASNS